MRIYKIAQQDGDGYLISPQGTLISVGWGNHATYLVHHPQLIDLTRPQMLDIISNNPMESIVALAIQQGFVHISIFSQCIIRANSLATALQYQEIIGRIAKEHHIIPRWNANYAHDSRFIINTTSYLNELPKKEPVEIANVTRTTIYKIAQHKLIGYKIVGYAGPVGDYNGKFAYSIYNKNFQIPLTLGNTVSDPKGFHLGNSKEYCINYFSGGTDDRDLLLTYEYKPEDLIKGEPEHKNSESIVRMATLVNVEDINEEF